MTYGVTDVNAGARGGEFLTGNLSYFTIKTIVPCYPTNVKTPLADALKARNFTSLAASRTITIEDGNGAVVAYDDNAEYTSAYNKQQNLNTLLNVFATRANPVVVNVTATTNANADTFTAFAANGVTADTFGSDYGAVEGRLYGIYTISIVTEKAGQWNVTSAAAGSNDAGYQFLNVLGTNIPALNTTATTPAGTLVNNTPTTQDVGATAFTVVGSVFVTAAGATLNTVAKASDVLPAVL
jgi:hypothetical protein